MAITRFRNSSILNRGPKYNDFLAGLPFRPIIGTATDGGTGTTVSVAFTGNNPAGAGITYTALSSPGNFTATGPASPITVTGLTAGTAYTFQVKAGNSLGDSAYSASSNSVTPITPTSFESIATATGTGSSGTITFSSIPGTYQHLQLRILSKVSATTTASYSAIIRLNGSSSSIYAEHFLTGNGATVTASAGNSPSTTSVGLWKASASSKTSSPNMANIMGVMIIDIHDYASTTKNKTVRYFAGTECNDTGTNASYVTIGSGLYAATTAVTSIDIITDGGTNFTTTSTFALYGIKGA